MTLTIKVVSYKGRSPVDQLERSFDKEGGTLGRLAETRKNHFTLPDPEKYISRKHALIRYENGLYYLTDTSVDGTYVLNKNLHISHDTVQLSDGDKLRIGDYDLIVNIRSSEVLNIATPSSGHAAAELSAFSDSRRMQYEPERERSNETGANPPWPQCDLSALGQERNHLIGHAEDSALRDSFSLPDIAVDTDQTQEIPKNFNFEELLNDLSGNANASTLPSIERPSKLEKIGREKANDARSTVDGLAVSAGASPETLQPTREQIYAELCKSFLDAAGVKGPDFLRGEEIPKLMRSVGAVFREMIEGLISILRGRSELKNQFRISATILKPNNNNPLKFSRNVDEVIRNLLKEGRPGFIDAAEAVREGYADIMNHQMAMTAGIQAAVLKLIERFDPKHFAERYEEGVVFQKKGKCWDAYTRVYPEIANEALEQFFGEAFSQAYEKQIRKLRDAKSGNEGASGK